MELWNKELGETVIISFLFFLRLAQAYALFLTGYYFDVKLELAPSLWNSSTIRIFALKLLAVELNIRG